MLYVSPADQVETLAPAGVPRSLWYPLHGNAVGELDDKGEFALTSMEPFVFGLNWEWNGGGYMSSTRA